VAGSSDTYPAAHEGTAAVIIRAVLVGMLVVFVGTIPRNIAYTANLRYGAGLPWGVPLTAVYLWLFWRYLRGDGPPDSTSTERRINLRANGIPGRLWAWALLAGGLGIVALVLALNLANRLIVLPQQGVPDLSNVPKATMLALLIFAAPVAGVIEEAAFRGYMQRPIEGRSGLAVAILITGTMFALAHLDFTPILWPYYVAVAAIYGTVTSLTDSILPAIVLHTAGNIYSNLDLWLHGQAEWQAGTAPAALIWQTGIDEPFRNTSIALLAVATLMTWAYSRLAAVAKANPQIPRSSSPQILRS
jgi:membrane protease YdiL (CAAX protease family)